MRDYQACRGDVIRRAKGIQAGPFWVRIGAEQNVLRKTYTATVRSVDNVHVPSSADRGVAAAPSYGFRVSGVVAQRDSGLWAVQPKATGLKRLDNSLHTCSCGITAMRTRG
jgi:hypothetical protein